MLMWCRLVSVVYVMVAALVLVLVLCMKCGLVFVQGNIKADFSGCVDIWAWAGLMMRGGAACTVGRFL